MVLPRTLPMLTMLAARLHVADARLRHPVGAVEVDVDHLPELLRRLLGRRVGGADPGVVDEDVEPAERVLGLLRDAMAVVGDGDVGGDRDAAAAECLDVGLGLLRGGRCGGRRSRCRRPRRRARRRTRRRGRRRRR